MSQKLITVLCVGWPNSCSTLVSNRHERRSRLTSHGSFESSRILLGDAVPLLRCSKVYVVDAVQIYILEMPRERSFPHAQVKVSGIDAGDCLAKDIQQVFQFGDIPASGRIIEQRSGHIRAIHRVVESQAFPVCRLEFAAAFWRPL